MGDRHRDRFRKWLGEKKNWMRIIVPLTVLVALFIAGRLVDVDNYLQALQKWLWSMGPWGPVAFVFIYVGAISLLMPGTPFTIAAAFLFGTHQGYFIMVAASSLAAITGFLVARYVARRSVEERFSNTSSYQKLKGMVEKNHRIAILFVRLMPFFPFAVNNYLLGLTRISFRSYLFYSELVFLPMNAVLIYGAYTIYRTMVVGKTPWMLVSITAVASFLVLGLGYLGKRVFASS